MLKNAGLPVLDTPSHILPVIVGNAHLCSRISERLLSDHGIYVQPINYPTVPRGQERLRITPTPFHARTDMYRLVSALLHVGFELGWDATPSAPAKHTDPAWQEWLDRQTCPKDDLFAPRQRGHHHLVANI